MSSEMEEKEKITKLLDEIKERNLFVIVEGIKDKKTLAKFGITDVITLSRKPLYAIAEESAEHDEVVLLTDLDTKGKQLYRKLSSDLQKYGVKINNKLREYLFKTKLRHIEGIDSYMELNSQTL